MASARYRGRMIVNDTDYTGSFVDPNPSGTATDTLQKVDIDGVIYDIQGGGGGSNLIVNAQIYSTEEKQVGVWTDGKPLYQKTFLFNQQVITDNAWTNNILGTVGSGIEIVDFEGTFGLENINPHFADFSYYRGSSEYFTAYVPNNNGSNDDIAVRPNMNAGINVTLDKCTIWYTKTTDAVGSGGFQAYGFTPIIYSTEEREIGVWINNKPLYQKTIVFGSITNRSSISIGVANVEHISLVPDGSWVNDGERPLPYVIGSDASNNIGGYFTIGTSDTSFDVRMGNGSASDSRNGAITVQYTKTTDVAGSGKYNTLGVPNVHYTTDEQVIGTWLGETLYERTFNGLSTNTNGDNWVNIGGIDASTWNEAVNVEIYCNSSDVNNKLTRIALAEARVFNGNVQVITSVAYNREINVATIQYTKTS